MKPFFVLLGLGLFLSGCVRDPAEVAAINQGVAQKLPPGCVVTDAGDYVRAHGSYPVLVVTCPAQTVRTVVSAHPSGKTTHPQVTVQIGGNFAELDAAVRSAKEQLVRAKVQRGEALTAAEVVILAPLLGRAP